MPPPRAGSISSGYGCPLGWNMLLPGPTRLPPGPLVPGGLNDGGMNNGLVYLLPKLYQFFYLRVLRISNNMWSIWRVITS